MKKRFVLPVTVLATAAFIIATAVPANAATTYTVGVINMANKQANPQAIAVDAATGNLYVGQQDGAHGAKIAALGPTGVLRTYIRVGESFDAATNLPPDGERPAPHAPSTVIALTINPNTHTLLALVTDSWIIMSPNYSHLNGSYVVAVNMRTNTVTRRYTVAELEPESGPPPVAHATQTMWTGFALDATNNVLWGVEGYWPNFNNGVARLNLTTGVKTRADLPVVANSTQIDPVPTIAFDKANGRGYVGVAGTLFGIDRTLRVVTTLRVPGRDPVACSVLPGSAPTATVASPATNTIYMNWCGSIYVVNGATNTVTHPIPTASYSKGLALDAPAQSLYVYETRNDVTGIGIYSTATTASLAFVPVSVNGSSLGRKLVDHEQPRPPQDLHPHLGVHNQRSRQSLIVTD